MELKRRADTLETDEHEINNIKVSTNKIEIKTLSVFILAVALSVHALFEGIAIGLQDSIHGSLNIAIAVWIRKIPASLALGINMK